MRTRHKMALARTVSRALVALRAAVGLPGEVVVRRGGLCWALDLREAIDLTIYLAGAFERRTLAVCRRAIRPGGTVLDIGANIGSHTLPLAAWVGAAGRVLACEPTAFAFRKLNANIRLNPMLAPRITPVQSALVARSSDRVPDRLYSSWPLGAAGVPVHAKHEGRLEATDGATATTLDDLVAQQKCDRIVLIKMDVDGHEPAVLQGAGRTLARDRPTIVMELAPYVLAETGSSVKALLDPLVAARYGLWTLGGRRLAVNEQALSAGVADGASLNVVARPR
jgi:FkbM family methyltransferase